MAYIDEAALEGAFGESEVADLATTPERLSSAISRAEAQVDSYLSSRYAVPLVSAPAVVVDAALKIARFELWDDSATEEVSRRRDQAIAWLKDIQAGRANLVGVDNKTADTSSTPPNVSAPAAVFTDDLLSRMP